MSFGWIGRTGHRGRATGPAGLDTFSLSRPGPRLGAGREGREGRPADARATLWGLASSPVMVGASEELAGQL